tara:strand:- start:2219 stop:2377 length:159 start_codon:yes stop_codon:yes gene_type:complete
VGTMTDFTKIRWAGSNCILITLTDNHNPRLPILILDAYDIEKLNKEWKSKSD